MCRLEIWAGGCTQDPGWCLHAWRVIRNGEEMRVIQEAGDAREKRQGMTGSRWGAGGSRSQLERWPEIEPAPPVLEA